jgi:hypothetical protein
MARRRLRQLATDHRAELGVRRKEARLRPAGLCDDLSPPRGLDCNAAVATCVKPNVQPHPSFDRKQTRARTWASPDFDEFCDRASEPRAILKIEFAT